MYKCRTDAPGFHFDDERDPVEKIEFEDASREFLIDVREIDRLADDEDLSHE